MLALDSAQLGLLADTAVGVVFLVELDFSDGTYRFTTFNMPLVISGQTYIATGALGSVGEIKESQDTDAQTLSLTLNVSDSAVLASTLGNVEGYRGRAARIYLQLLDVSFRPVGAPKLRFTGEMEPVKVKRDEQPAEGGPVGGTIELPISRAGMSRARNSEGLRLTHEQQQADYPGDLGLQY
ncbi:hypothetical protein DBR42_28925, partial [Pelomonas sp. HMWF004]